MADYKKTVSSFKDLDEYIAARVDSFLSIKILPEEIPGDRRYSVKQLLQNEKQFFDKIEAERIYGPVVLGIEQFNTSWTDEKILRTIAEISERFKKDIYLAVPLRDYSRMEELAISIAEEEYSTWEYYKTMYKDDYVFEIVDQRKRNSGFLKLYPSGEISLHMFRKRLPDPVKTFKINDFLLEEAKSFAREQAGNLCNTELNPFFVDDREFLDGYRVECGFAWLEKTAPFSRRVEYFAETSAYPIINKIMAFPQLAEFFRVEDKYIQKGLYPKCPFCGSEETAEIIYGYISNHDPLWKMMREGRRWVPGGCEVPPDPDQWFCMSCRRSFRSAGKDYKNETDNGNDCYVRAVIVLRDDEGSGIRYDLNMLTRELGVWLELKDRNACQGYSLNDEQYDTLRKILRQMKQEYESTMKNASEDYMPGYAKSYYQAALISDDGYPMVMQYGASRDSRLIRAIASFTLHHKEKQAFGIIP